MNLTKLVQIQKMKIKQLHLKKKLPNFINGVTKKTLLTNNKLITKYRK